MKVLIVVRWPVGGIRTYLNYVYREMIQRGYKCTFVIVDESETEILREDLSRYGANWCVLPSGRSIIVYAKRILNILRKENYDLIHAHGFTSGGLAFFPAKITRTPIIMTSHDVLLSNQFSGFKGSLKKKLLATMFNNMTLVQSVSFDAKKNLHEMLPLFIEKRSKVIMNGVDEERFLSAKPFDFHQVHNIPQDTMLVAFFGRFMGQKGFRYIVDAIEQLKDDQNFNKSFVVITVGDGGFFREEVIDIKNKGLQEYFCHLPYVPNIAEMAKSVDAVLIPSLWEACPLLPMEIMIAGTPIITTNCIGLREVTENTPAIKVPERDGFALAEAIKGIDDEASFKAKAFVSEAAKRFTIKHTIDEVDKMYKSIESV